MPASTNTPVKDIDSAVLDAICTGQAISIPSKLTTFTLTTANLATLKNTAKNTLGFMLGLHRSIEVDEFKSRLLAAEDIANDITFNLDQVGFMVGNPLDDSQVNKSVRLVIDTPHYALASDLDLKAFLCLTVTDKTGLNETVVITFKLRAFLHAINGS